MPVTIGLPLTLSTLAVTTLAVAFGGRSEFLAPDGISAAHGDGTGQSWSRCRKRGPAAPVRPCFR